MNYCGGCGRIEKVSFNLYHESGSCLCHILAVDTLQKKLDNTLLYYYNELS